LRVRSKPARARLATLPLRRLDDVSFGINQPARDFPPQLDGIYRLVFCETAQHRKIRAQMGLSQYNIPDSQHEGAVVASGPGENVAQPAS
jgi:hypothetical protein